MEQTGHHIEYGGLPKQQDHVVDLLQRHGRNASNVLDIGCGGGQYREVFAESYVGIDLSQSRYQGDGPDALADGQHLPFEDSSFDFIFLVGVLHVIPNPQKALTESARVLTAGGKLLVFDYNYLGTRRLAEMKKAAQQPASAIWSPWRIAQLVEDTGLKTRVEWDYVRGSFRPWLFLQRFRLVRYLRFWFWQLRPDWSVIVGEKQTGQAKRG